MLRWLAAGLAALLLSAGCQSSGEEAGTATEPGAVATEPARTAPAQTAASETAPPAAGTTDKATMERVVRSWSEHLNAGDNDGLAHLFAPPAVIAQGPAVLEARSFEQIAAFFAQLPCSGRVTSITFEEPDVAVAVFELGDRPASMCDGPPGSRAAARFGFRAGKLVLWQQVPVPGEAPPAATGEQQI